MKKPTSTKEIELRPGAWAQFEKMIKAVAAAGPQHVQKNGKIEKAKKATTSAKPKRQQKI